MFAIDLKKFRNIASTREVLRIVMNNYVTWWERVDQGIPHVDICASRSSEFKKKNDLDFCIKVIQIKGNFGHL